MCSWYSDIINHNIIISRRWLSYVVFLFTLADVPILPNDALPLSFYCVSNVYVMK